MQSGSLISSSDSDGMRPTLSSPTVLYTPSTSVMSNFFGTLIAILTLSLPITLISQNSSPIGSASPTASPVSPQSLLPHQPPHPPSTQEISGKPVIKPIAPAAIVPPQTLTTP